MEKGGLSFLLKHIRFLDRAAQNITTAFQISPPVKEQIYINKVDVKHCTHIPRDLFV